MTFRHSSRVDPASSGDCTPVLDGLLIQAERFSGEVSCDNNNKMNINYSITMRDVAGFPRCKYYSCGKSKTSLLIKHLKCVEGASEIVWCCDLCNAHQHGDVRSMGIHMRYCSRKCPAELRAILGTNPLLNGDNKVAD